VTGPAPKWASLCLMALGVCSCERRADVFDLSGLEAASLEGVAVRELAHLSQQGVTVAQWQTLYPTDSVRVNSSVPRFYGHGHRRHCGYATRSTPASGLLVIRDAMFSFRDVPMPGSLPESREDANLLAFSTCVLTAVVITVTPADSSGGAALAASLGEAIATRLRGATPTVIAHEYEPGLMVNAAASRSGDLEVRSYYHARAHQVLARAEMARAEPVAGGGASAEDGRILRRAVALSGLDSATAAPLLAAEQRISLVSSDWPRPSDTALIVALESWVGAARALPPERRAAALLAADRLMTMAGALADTGFADRLRALGASVTVQRLEDEFEGVPGVVLSYGRNWLGETLQLVSGGEIVDLTLVPALLGSVQDRCAVYADSAARAGEALLARAGTADTRFALHRLTAQAYAMLREKPEDRRRAMEHYRAALAIDSTSARAAALWREAYDFALGVQPNGWMMTEMC